MKNVATEVSGKAFEKQKNSFLILWWRTDNRTGTSKRVK
jgi:hypothetical protein